jgi:prepilin-type N-terminal cleavage/methylation domain-containing protein
MKRSGDNNAGFSLIELVIAIAIMGILASIATPKYMSYIKIGKAVSCTANRRNIKAGEHGSFFENDKRRSIEIINELFSCPSGGIYIWLKDEDSDQDNPDYLSVGCSIHHWTEAVPEKTEAMFSSNFDNMDDLTSLIGNWEIKDGALTPTGHGEHRLAFGDTDWTDYELKTNATLTKGQGYAIYYRADGDSKITGYAFQVDPGYGNSFIVRRVYDGKEKSPFQRVKMPAGFPVYNKSHDISIAVVGNQHVIKVDDEVIMEFDDDAFASGSAGLRSWGQTEVTFDNVNVAELY